MEAEQRPAEPVVDEQEEVEHPVEQPEAGPLEQEGLAPQPWMTAEMMMEAAEAERQSRIHYLLDVLGQSTRDRAVNQSQRPPEQQPK